MDTRILKSILTIAVIVALGAGVTYSQFVSNVVTISASSLETGSAEIKLCNADGDDSWKNTISPSLSLADLAPGDTDVQLTEGTAIYAGNDSGDLTNNIESECGSYGDTAGSSDVDLNLVPQVTSLTCNEVLDDQFSIKFEIGGQQTAYKTLTEWTTNTDTAAPVFSPDDTNQVKVFAQLDSGATLQGETCTFDITFEGQQP